MESPSCKIQRDNFVLEDAGQVVCKYDFFFKFPSRAVDWALVHGVDVDDVTRSGDVETINSIMSDLMQMDIAKEHRKIYEKNYVQFVRLLQLAAEVAYRYYDTNKKLLDLYACIIPGAEDYIADGNIFLDIVDEYKNISTKPTTGFSEVQNVQQRLDNARNAMKQKRSQYNVLLDALEVTESKLKEAKFRFKQRSAYFDWQIIHSMDFNNEPDQRTILDFQQTIIFGDILKENFQELQSNHYKQLIHALLFIAQYWVHQCKLVGKNLDSKHEDLNSMSRDVSIMDIRIKEEEKNLQELEIELKTKNFDTKDVNTQYQPQFYAPAICFDNQSGQLVHFPSYLVSSGGNFVHNPSHQVSSGGNFVTYSVEPNESLKYKFFLGDTYVEDLDQVKQQIWENKQKIKEIREEAKLYKYASPCETFQQSCMKCLRTKYRDSLGQKKIVRGIKQNIQEFESKIWDSYQDRRYRRQNFVIGATTLQNYGEEVSDQFGGDQSFCMNSSKNSFGERETQLTNQRMNI